MSTTTKIPVPDGEWTAVTLGGLSGGNVVIWGNPAGYRVAVGAEPPADLTIGILAGRGLAEPGLLTLSNLDNGDIVYLTPVDGRDFVAQVIAKND